VLRKITAANVEQLQCEVDAIGWSGVCVAETYVSKRNHNGNPYQCEDGGSDIGAPPSRRLDRHVVCHILTFEPRAEGMLLYIRPRIGFDDFH
jgi:hypothetical protein